MGKTTKKTLKYINGKLPENLGELLEGADENDLRILVSLLMAADSEGTFPEDFSPAAVLGLEEEAVNASLKFLRGAGILVSGSASASWSQAKASTAVEKPAAAHKDGALESEDKVSDYTTEELAGVLERRTELAGFIDEAQRVFGRTFNTYEINIIVGIVDRLELEPNAVLTILSYARSIGKTTMRYCEKMAISLYDEGYTKSDEISEHLAALDRYKDMVSQLKQMFGMGSRSLSKSEKMYFERWTQEYGYGTDVIQHAYDITVDTIQKPVPKYTNTILEKWFSLELRTLDDVLRYEQEQKSGKGAEGSGTGKSYVLDDFFEAALQRSFEDMN